MTVQQNESRLNSVFTSAAVDQEATETDEGIGESETDVASSTDADASCLSFASSYCQPYSNVTSSPPTNEHVPQHSNHCCAPGDEQTQQSSASVVHQVSADKLDDVTASCRRDVAADLVDSSEMEHRVESQDGESSQLSSVTESTFKDGCLADALKLPLTDNSGSSQTYDVLDSLSPGDDDPALSEDSGSSQTLSVTQSLSRSDDDQGSLTDVTETAHSDDSGSSRTVEVGDEDVPQLLDDEVEADISLRTDPLVPDAAVASATCQPVSSQSPAAAASGNMPWDSEEAAKDVTLTKESGENWDEEPTLNLRPDDEDAACKYNYCFVQRSPFQLGFERSESVFITLAIILS